MKISCLFFGILLVVNLAIGSTFLDEFNDEILDIVEDDTMADDASTYTFKSSLQTATITESNRGLLEVDNKATQNIWLRQNESNVVVGDIVRWMSTAYASYDNYDYAMFGVSTKANLPEFAYPYEKTLVVMQNEYNNNLSAILYLGSSVGNVEQTITIASGSWAENQQIMVEIELTSDGGICKVFDVATELQIGVTATFSGYSPNWYETAISPYVKLNGTSAEIDALAVNAVIPPQSSIGPDFFDDFVDNDCNDYEVGGQGVVFGEYDGALNIDTLTGGYSWARLKSPVVEVKKLILEAINTGKFKPGQKLEGQKRLSNEFGVSDSTVRHALNDLAREGLVFRVHGSGTYIRKIKKRPLTLNIPFADPEKILLQHFWEKLTDFAKNNARKVSINKITEAKYITHTDSPNTIKELFTSSNPASIYEIPSGELPTLVNLGICDNFTDNFKDWPQSKNIHKIAIDSTTFKNQIYALPFHCMLSSLVYHSDIIDKIGINLKEATTSIDNFLNLLRAISKKTHSKYSIWIIDARMILTHLLCAFYNDLYKRFTELSYQPIEREIGIEVLHIIHRLKWEFNAFILGPLDLGTYYPSDVIKSFYKGEIPVALTDLSTIIHKAKNEKYNLLKSTPFSWKPNGRQFSLFNAYVWIVNSQIDEALKEFAWRFLQYYASAETEIELDQFHMDKGQLNSRNNCFINSQARIIDTTTYKENRNNLFEIAQLDVPFNVAIFDQFLFSVYRVLANREIDIEKEYEFYLAGTMKTLNTPYYNFIDGVLS